MGGYVDRIGEFHRVSGAGIGAEMAKYRGNLPQLASPTVMLSDSGMETDLIFHEGFDLPLFASFTMLEDSATNGCSSQLLPTPHSSGAWRPRRIPPRSPDLAGQHRLGHATWSRRDSSCRREPPGD